MKAASFKLGVSFASMVLAVLCLRWTHGDAFFFLFLVAGLMTVLYWIDLGRMLRDIERPTTMQKLLGGLMGIPEAILGLVSIGIGLSIVGWVLYNSFVQRQPEYTGSFLTFGVGPALLLVGIAWLMNAFRKTSRAKDST